MDGKSILEDTPTIDSAVKTMLSVAKRLVGTPSECFRTVNKLVNMTETASYVTMGMLDSRIGLMVDLK